MKKEHQHLSFQVTSLLKNKKNFDKMYVQAQHFLSISRSSFTVASFLSSTSIISERADGTWNRVMAAGVRPNHFIISHLIEGSIITALQFFEWAIYAIFFLPPSITLNASLLTALLLLLTGISGLCFGLFVSVAAKTVMSSLVVSQNFIYPTSFISGN